MGKTPDGRDVIAGDDAHAGERVSEPQGFTIELSVGEGPAAHFLEEDRVRLAFGAAAQKLRQCGHHLVVSSMGRFPPDPGKAVSAAVT